MAHRGIIKWTDNDGSEQNTEFDGLGNLVLLIFQKYLEMNSGITYDQFKKAFPDNTLKLKYPDNTSSKNSIRLLIEKEKYDTTPALPKARKRYITDGYITIGGTPYYVTGEWGRGNNEDNNNIEPLIELAKNNGIEVQFNDAKTISDVIESAIELNDNKQIILYGAPGTGKTYSVKKYVLDKVANDEKRYEFVQFHPAYDYSDFVEGLRPVVLCSSKDEDPTFVRIDGTFKAFCRRIIEQNAINAGIDLDLCSYNNENEEKYKEFIEAYVETEKKPIDKKYFFIIDEINRADLSKVFGELMFSLEESYRNIKDAIKTQYSNLRTYEVDKNTGKAKLIEKDVFRGGFFIPKNLYIIGTMNDIDKSVEAFDFALRRRFEWIEIQANDYLEAALKEITGIQNITKLVNKIKKMNEVISTEGAKFGLNESYHIGHAYFKKYTKDDDTLSENIFNNNIRSILKEYTRGRNRKDVEEFIEKCRNALLG